MMRRCRGWWRDRSTFTTSRSARARRWSSRRTTTHRGCSDRRRCSRSATGSSPTTGGERGRSASPPGDWTAADLANDLAGFLDALGIEKAIVGGSSLGGVVTAQFAVDHPGRALALIIGHTVPYLDDIGRAWLEDEIVAARTGLTMIARQPRSSPDEREGPPTTDPAFAASWLGRMIATTGTGLGRTRNDAARAIAVLRNWDQRPRKADLARIDVPTLVIVGEREPRSTIDGSREWASWIPGAEFVVLPGAHHAAPREAAPDWNAAVQGFLDRHGLGGQSTS